MHLQLLLIPFLNKVFSYNLIFSYCKERRLRVENFIKEKKLLIEEDGEKKDETLMEFLDGESKKISRAKMSCSNEVIKKLWDLVEDELQQRLDRKKMEMKRGKTSNIIYQYQKLIPLMIEEKAVMFKNLDIEKDYHTLAALKQSKF